MNAKQTIVVMLAMCTPVGFVDACRLILVNDQKVPVSIINLQDKRFTRTVFAPDDEKHIGDEDERAFFKMSVRGKNYELKQITCSPANKVELKVSDIIKGRLDPRMFTVEEGSKRIY